MEISTDQAANGKLINKLSEPVWDFSWSQVAQFKVAGESGSDSVIKSVGQEPEDYLAPLSYQTESNRSVA